MPSDVVILGSTGSIGKSALKVADSFSDEINIKALTCNSNLDLLSEQIDKFKPEAVAVADLSVANSTKFQDIKNKYRNIDFLTGEEGVIEIASIENDILLSAIVGGAGLKPSIEGIAYTKRIALANKETLVMSGDIFNEELRKYDTELIPVDSEHSAVFSLLIGGNKQYAEKIIITASGGSLRDYDIEDLENVTVNDALNHPTWSMGAKITIDSATLMNKGLEVIEAHHLFGFDYDNIDVVIHPESIIHSMVETIDGAVYAHMGITDMVFPIMNSFFYPEKKQNLFGKLDFSKLSSLTFREYDSNRFPALKLCYEAGKTGETAPAVLNAANEIAVAAFLDEKIKYKDIYSVIDETLQISEIVTASDLEQIFNADNEARTIAENIIKKRYL